MVTNSIRKSWILHNQWWTTTKSFKLEKGTSQGDQISAYLFIVVLEIAFIFIKGIKNIKNINIFNNIFFCSAYADDTTFFLSDEDSVIEVMNAFEKFSLVSGSKSNETKCEIAGIGVLKGVSLVPCGMDYGLNQKNKKNFRNTHFL